jgi:N-acetylglucosaminyldiphosphoundecaprenol N-acetyl-beta-D-mannosaminyltransferase
MSDKSTDVLRSHFAAADNSRPEMPQAPARNYSFLGVKVRAMNFGELVDFVSQCDDPENPKLIFHHNLHSAYTFKKDPAFRAAYEQAAAVCIDGVPLIWAGRSLGLNLTIEDRITFVDKFEPLLAEAACRKWRVFYLGSSPKVIAAGLPYLRHKNPGLMLEGRHGYFDQTHGGSEGRKVIEEINEFKPHILFVGLGVPRQEYWLAHTFSLLRANAIFTCGATMDYVTGEVRRPPEFIGKLGFYWLFRLFNQPGYLWRRYLVEPWSLLSLWLRDLIKSRRGKS